MSQPFKPSLPVAGRLRLRFATFDALVNRLARHIAQDGMFIPTENLRPEGTLIAIEVSLQSGDIILEAEGEVLWTRKTNTAQQPMGMALRFINLSEASKQLVWRIAHMNREAGIPPAVSLSAQEFVHTDLSNAVDIIETSKSTPLGDKAAGDSPVIGIDFGTSNSCVAYMNGVIPKLVPTDKGGLIVPSVVALTEKGKIIVGQHAKEQLLIHPQQSIYGVKRLLGRNYHSPGVRDMIQRFPYVIKPDANNEILITLGDKDYTLPQIASFIFTHLKESAEGYLQTAVQHAIVTVPAYFSETQRAAVKKAASLAGLQVDLVFNEPTAAALAYGYNKDYEKRVLVFDLGGGTFDVSILEINANIFEVKGAGGDPFLGGFDFDQRLIDHIVTEFEKESKQEIRKNLVVMQRISNAAENAKIQLSFQRQVDIHLPYIAERKGKPIDLMMTITRDQLNAMTKDLVERALEICGQAVHSMGLLPSDIDEVLLVGGQTRMPYLQQRVQEYFNREPSHGVHPDEAVAAGAALLGYSLQMIDGPMLMDLLALPIGIALPESQGGRSVKNLFPKLAPLPCSKTFTLSELLQMADAQKVLRLCQGEAEELSNNEYIGDIHLQLKYLQGDPDDINVLLELTPEGILRIQARLGNAGKVEPMILEMATAKNFSTQATSKSIPANEKGGAKKETRSIFGKMFTK